MGVKHAKGVCATGTRSTALLFGWLWETSARPSTRCGSVPTTHTLCFVPYRAVRSLLLSSPKSLWPTMRCGAPPTADHPPSRRCARSPDRRWCHPRAHHHPSSTRMHEHSTLFGATLYQHNCNSSVLLHGLWPIATHTHTHTHTYTRTHMHTAAAVDPRAPPFPAEAYTVLAPFAQELHHCYHHSPRDFVSWTQTRAVLSIFIAHGCQRTPR